MLEAAVGTGRLLVPILQAGLHVEGIDSSAEMLTYCRRNCTVAGVEATLHCGALETMDLRHRYAAIVISLGSFMLLSGPGEATAALDRMRRHLLPGGWLFLDADAPGVHAESPDRHESRRVVQCPDGATIVLVDAPLGDDATDGIERRDGRVVAREVQDLHLRRYDHDELRDLLTGAGFVNIDACGDYAEETPVATARTWLCFSGQRQGGSA